MDYYVLTQKQIDQIYQNIISEDSSSGDLTNLIAAISKSYERLEESHVINPEELGSNEKWFR